MAGNRQYKSDVFSMLLEEPQNALEVFNAVNGTDYADPSMVEIYMLDKGVSLSIYNDASFILDMNLSLYEHQSTYNPNIPLRNLITTTDTTNATTIPTKRYTSSDVPRTPPPAMNFAILRRLAPSITGIARKKVNFAAASLLIPMAMEPTIVEPDLEAPGNTAARSWNNPIATACPQLSWFTVFILGSFPFMKRSTTMNAILTFTATSPGNNA